MGTLVTLTSDYGTKDAYVAEVKAVLLSAPKPPVLVDITHEVPAFDIAFGALQLWRSFHFFPKGTWHLALVDPATKLPRRGVYVQTKTYHFLGPNNGVLKWAVEEAERRDKKKAKYFELPLANAKGPGYWGRDTYAAFFRNRETLKKQLRPIQSLEGDSFPLPSKKAGSVTGTVLAVDGFGNLITNLSLTDFPAGTGQIAQRKLRVFTEYSDLPQGEPGFIPGSNGLWEISLRNASATAQLGLGVGTLLSWYPRS